MSGNVWEWTNDGYGAYSSGSAIDPVGASSGSIRVFRGGSWGGDADYATVSYRYRDPPDHASNGVGFRLVRSAP